MSQCQATTAKGTRCSYSAKEGEEYCGIHLDKEGSVGRPPKYDSAKDLQDAIDAYFDKDGPKTITGLALALGFDSRQSLYDYQQKEEFSYIIKRARLQVEHAYEIQLIGSNATGPIFALKNMGWDDKQQIDHTSKGESFNKIEVEVVDPKDKG